MKWNLLFKKPYSRDILFNIWIGLILTTSVIRFIDNSKKGKIGIRNTASAISGIFDGIFGIFSSAVIFLLILLPIIYFRNYLSFKKQDATRNLANEPLKMQSNTDIDKGDDKTISNAIREFFESSSKSKKYIFIALSVLFILVISTSIYKSPIIRNTFSCNSLKKEIKVRNEISRQLWNSYQNEVSNLANYPEYSETYFNQVNNVARRLTQVYDSNKSGYELIIEKPYCAKNEVEVRLKLNNESIVVNFLNGTRKNDKGETWSVYNGWNTKYYNIYYDLDTLLK